MDYFSDKKWMYEYRTKPARCHPDFVGGIDYFIQYAKQQLGFEENSLMRCPCAKCENRHFLVCETIKFHIILEGFTPLYNTWYYHGERPGTEREYVHVETRHGEEMRMMLDDAFMQEVGDDSTNPVGDIPELRRFEELLDKAKKPLYAGCQKYSTLSFMVHLFQLKCLNKWTNKSFSDVISLIKDALPGDNTLPQNWYESKKLMADLGMDYVKIHACPNDCVLFSQEAWDQLVAYWNDDAMVEMSKRNKVNRTRMKSTHTLGAKSLSRFYEEEQAKKKDEFSYVESYLLAHKRKDGTYPNEKTAAVCTQVETVAIEQEVHRSKDPTEVIPVLDKVFGGHHGGYERGFGPGAPPRRGASASTAMNTIEIATLRAELEAEKRDKEVLRETLQSEKEDKDKMKEEMEVMKQQMMAILQWQKAQESIPGGSSA